MDVVLSFCSICPLIAYFIKKNYSLTQNIFEKYEGLREVTHISPNLCLFASYWSWDLIGNRQREGTMKICWKRVTGRCTGRCCPASGQFTGGELLVKEWPDATSVCPVRRGSSVWSIEGRTSWTDRTLPAFGHGPPDASGPDSRGIGPLWNRPDAGW